jgi:large conductance mechanosensitive channel
MSLRREFQAFVFRGNVIDLAVGVIVGAAFGKIVDAFVKDLVMPLLTPLLGAGGNWRTATWHPTEKIAIPYGHFLGEVVDFLIVAAVLFFVLVKLFGSLRRKEAPPAPPAMRPCPECLEPVFLAAKRCKFCTSAIAALLLLFLAAPGTAFAQPPDPTFKFATPEEPKKESERNVQVRGGLVTIGGNSRATSGTLGGLGAYKRGSDRVAAEASLSYVRTSALVANDVDGDGLIGGGGELARQRQVTSELYQARLRYDRFLTLNNSAYVSAQALSDVPAGKEIVGGGQIGASRQLWKNDRHRVVAELGYDFSYEKAAAADAQGIQIHSGRVFLAEEAKLTADTGVILGVELLTNLNAERAPATGYEGADALEDTRVNGKLGLTTRLWQNLSFGFTANLRYDADPAPLKSLRLPFAAAFRPRAEELDYNLEATLILTLL